MLVARLKEKRCKGCAEPFLQQRAGQQACSPSCAIQIARHKREKAELKKLEAAKRQERQQDKERKERLKTRRDWINDAQREFNRYIRLRDKAAGHSCIGCGEPLEWAGVGGKTDAGHWRSVGSAPQLRFNPDNCHAQRVVCNRYGAGRAVDYRIGLIQRIGEDRVLALEQNQEVAKWTIEELKQIRDTYRQKAKALEKDHEA